MTPLLEVIDISKRFGGLLAVSHVSFTVDAGEIVGLIGPNGAGKTTLFNLVDGVFRPDSGTIRLEGRDITGMPPHRIAHLGVARTHQIVKPLNDLTVLDNVKAGACFGREYLGLDAARAVAREVLERIGLASRAEVPARALTLAEKRRLEVARALAAMPKLLLLDEVLSGLNPAEVAQMIDLVRGIREAGVAVLLIEHLMQAVMNLSGRIIVLNFGQKIAEGSPQEVSRNPQVVEAYLGDPDIAQKLMEKR